MLLEIGQTSNLDQSFNLSDYPKLVSFGAMANKGLRTLDPSGCPNLQRLSIDGTNVQTLDLSKNPNITILNISETGIKDIDLSNLKYLQQLYVDHRSASVNAQPLYGRLHSAVVDYRLAHEEFEVPFWIWTSKKYRKVHPEWAGLHFLGQGVVVVYFLQSRMNPVE